MEKNMNNLNRQIQILENITTSNTITDLAQSLFLSQPYISRLIKQMEDKYQVTLIERNKQPLKLTLAGRTVLNDLRQIQQAQVQMQRNIAQLKKQESQTVTISLISLLGHERIIAISNQLIKHFPTVKFNIIVDGQRPTEGDLLDKNIDILVGPKWNNPLINISPLPLQELALLIPASCPLYRPGRLYCPFSENNLATLNGSTYVEANDSSFIQVLVNNFLATNKIQIKQLATVSSIQLATEIAILQHATTITTTAIANHVLHDRHDYNLMVFPKDTLNLHIAISSLTHAPTKISEIHHYLKKVLQ
jgi:DNA-binding transcriptional LysR family regulator